MVLLFNGKELSDKFIIKAVETDVLPPVSQNKVSVLYRPGTIDLGNTLGERIINVTIMVVGDNIKDLRVLVRELAEFLYYEEDKQLILTDEPDKYYNAKISGDTRLDELLRYGETTLQFVCSDPFAYSLEEKVVEYARIEDGQLILNDITNDGTYEVEPKIEIINGGENARKGEALYLSFLKDNQQIGGSLKFGTLSEQVLEQRLNNEKNNKVPNPNGASILVEDVFQEIKNNPSSNKYYLYNGSNENTNQYKDSAITYSTNPPVFVPKINNFPSSVSDFITQGPRSGDTALPSYGTSGAKRGSELYYLLETNGQVYDFESSLYLGEVNFLDLGSDLVDFPNILQHKIEYNIMAGTTKEFTVEFNNDLDEFFSDSYYFNIRILDRNNNVKLLIDASTSQGLFDYTNIKDLEMKVFKNKNTFKFTFRNRITNVTNTYTFVQSGSELQTTHIKAGFFGIGNNVNSTYYGLTSFKFYKKEDMFSPLYPNNPNYYYPIGINDEIIVYNNYAEIEKNGVEFYDIIDITSKFLKIPKKTTVQLKLLTDLYVLDSGFKVYIKFREKWL